MACWRSGEAQEGGAGSCDKTHWMRSWLWRDGRFVLVCTRGVDAAPCFAACGCAARLRHTAARRKIGRDEVEEVANSAVKEEQIEVKLASIESDWAAFNLVRRLRAGASTPPLLSRRCSGALAVATSGVPLERLQAATTL